MDPGLKIAGVTKRWESRGFKDCGPLIEPFRGDDKRMIETFRGDDLLFCHSRNLLSGIQMLFKTMDPGLKIAGVTRGRESRGFQYCGPRLKDCRGDEEVGIQILSILWTPA